MTNITSKGKNIERGITRRRLPLGAAALLSLGAITRSSEAEAAASETNAPDPNAALIMRAYDAFGRGDMPTVFAALAEEIVWHVPGRGPLSRDYHGHAEVLGFFQHFTELSAGTFRLQIDEVLAKGDRVVVMCTESAQRAGRNWSSSNIHVWTVKDGRAIAFREYQGDEQGEDEFWSAST